MRRMAFMVVLSMAVLLSACGGNDDKEIEETVVEEPSEEETTEEAEVVHLDYPDESEIIEADYVTLYNNYSDSDNGKWYRLTMPVYGVTDDGITVYEGLNEDSILHFISVDFVDISICDTLHKGDEITVVALLDKKITVNLKMINGYVDNVATTENTITDEIIVIDDYVSFYENYSQTDIGKTIQITAVLDDISGDVASVKEGLPDGFMSEYVFYDLPEDDVANHSSGETVTIVGRCASKIGNALTLNDSYIVD